MKIRILLILAVVLIYGTQVQAENKDFNLGIGFTRGTASEGFIGFFWNDLELKLSAASQSLSQTVGSTTSKVDVTSFGVATIGKKPIDDGKLKMTYGSFINFGNGKIGSNDIKSAINFGILFGVQYPLASTLVDFYFVPFSSTIITASNYDSRQTSILSDCRIGFTYLF